MGAFFKFFSWANAVIFIQIKFFKLPSPFRFAYESIQFFYFFYTLISFSPSQSSLEIFFFKSPLFVCYFFSPLAIIRGMEKKNCSRGCKHIPRISTEIFLLLFVRHDKHGSSTLIWVHDRLHIDSAVSIILTFLTIAHRRNFAAPIVWVMWIAIHLFYESSGRPPIHMLPCIL